MSNATADAGSISADGALTADSGSIAITADSGSITADGSLTADGGAPGVTADSGSITADSGFVTADGSSASSAGLAGGAVAGAGATGNLGALIPPKPAKIFFSVQRASPDGLYWPNYPQGNHP